MNIECVMLPINLFDHLIDSGGYCQQAKTLFPQELLVDCLSKHLDDRVVIAVDIK